jgi:hypothetical protein
MTHSENDNAFRKDTGWKTSVMQWLLSQVERLKSESGTVAWADIQRATS